MLESLGFGENATRFTCCRNGFGCLKLALLLSLLLHAVIFVLWGIGDARLAPSGDNRTLAPLVVGLPASASSATVQKTESKVAQGHLTDTANSLATQGDSPAVVLVPLEALTEIPFALGDVGVDFPEVEQPRAGVVRLKLTISPSGRVMTVDLLETDLPPEYVEQAIATFASQKFSPGKIGQLEVATAIEIEVSFDPDGIF